MQNQNSSKNNVEGLVSETDSILEDVPRGEFYEKNGEIHIRLEKNEYRLNDYPDLVDILGRMSGIYLRLMKRHDNRR